MRDVHHRWSATLPPIRRDERPQIRDKAHRRRDRTAPQTGPHEPTASRRPTTHTFWLSDVGSSTRLWEEHPEALKEALSVCQVSAWRRRVCPPHELTDVHRLVEALYLFTVPIANRMPVVEDFRDLAANEDLVCAGQRADTGRAMDLGAGW